MNKERFIIDKSIRYLLLFFALISIIVLFLIAIFIVKQASPALTKIPLTDILFKTEWRPTMDKYGILAMIVGSVMVTLGSLILGVPLALGCAIFLAEIAPKSVQELLRPAVQLLGGIPSVVFGLFGMVVLVPLVRSIKVAGNTGFGLLSASIVLAIMILPTITSIAEDAIRAVPQSYRNGSLALGATKWQTIVKVVLPAARSGILASIILGIGRALGETMAMIMVIGNSVMMPKPLNANPFTIWLRQARTLTGSIAVEINYAAPTHESVLFVIGVVLFIMIMLVNVMARSIIRRTSAAK
ncbi:MAG: phosphate ABC transporter permease subunit PstC [Anaerolineaceae bacterium]|nr:phosphate ABC transporter permease subunit PstC [Anaerolineaceae bacterium]